MSHQGNHNIIESQQERILQLEAELEICREALKELIGGEWETVMIGTAYRRRTLTYTFEQVEKLYNLISSPPSELGRKVMDEHASMIDALKSIQQNDKTEYDYNGKEALNRNGQKPGPGKRFSTPREIAMAELDNLQKGGG